MTVSATHAPRAPESMLLKRIEVLLKAGVLLLFEVEVLDVIVWKVVVGVR